MRLALVLCGLAATSIVVTGPPASALGSAVQGTFLCQQTVTAAGAAGVSAGVPQILSSTVTAPATSDVSSPATAQVALTAAAGSSWPTSPDIPMTDVTLSQVSVRLDVYETATNSPATIAGAPATSALGTRTLSAVHANLGPASPWDMDAATPEVEFLPVDVALPTGAEGTRQWLRLKQVTFSWTSGADVIGTTTCRLVGSIPSSAQTTDVDDPVFGFLSPLSSQYPESATGFAAGSATFASFGARVLVTDTEGSTPPPSSTCTVVDTTGCTTGQQVTTTVIAGQLSQQADQASGNPSSSAIVLRAAGGASSVTVSNAAQTMTGPLNPVTVTDVRGGAAGWSLTAALSGPFTEIGGGAMPTSAVKLQGVACAPVPGSATRTTGSGGTLTSAVTLCGVDPGVDDSDGQSGGGQYEVSGTVELTVPAFQKAGDYTTTLVVTLT